MHLRLLDILTPTPLHQVDLLLHSTSLKVILQAHLHRHFRHRRSLRQFHHAVRILAHVDGALVARDVTAEALGEFGPQVLPGFGVAVDHVESLVPALGFRGRPEGEAGVQAGRGEAVEEGVKGLAAGEHEVAVDLLGDGRVETEGRGEVHEVALCDADDVVGVGDDPVPGGFFGFIGEDTLLMVVEVGRPPIAFDPGVGFFHGLFWTAEMDAVLLGACGEDDTFELPGGAGDVEGVEEVGQHGAVDVPVFLFSVFL